jgi:RES domain
LKLWRVGPFTGAIPTSEGGGLWIPRPFQGDGRHDNPDLYGVLYATADPVAAIVEALAPFRGTGPLTQAILRRVGQPLMLAEITLDDDSSVIDLDDPATLVAEHLRPSAIATRRRLVTQSQATSLFRSHPEAAALRWWSAYEATWAQLSVFDRATRRLGLEDVTPLTVDLPEVNEAATFLGLVG